MRTKLLITMLLTVGLLSACSEMNPHPMDMSQAVQSARTKADHEALAQHYEEVAKEMQTKVDEHKKLLAIYQRDSFLYAKQIPSMTVHCQNLINVYEQAVVSNRKMAAMHRELER